MKNGILNWLYLQNNSIKRLGAIRISIGLISLIHLIGNFDFEFYKSFSIFFLKDHSTSWYIASTKYGLDIIYFGAIFTGLLFTLGIGRKLVSIIYAILFIVLQYYTSRFEFGIWSYNTHLVFFIAVISLSKSYHTNSFDRIFTHLSLKKNLSSLSERDIQFGSFVISFIQLYISFIYLQAGISKLTYSGFEWFIHGRTIQFFSLLSENSFSVFLSKYPTLFSFFGILSGIIEFSILPLLLIKKFKQICILTMLFHLGTWLVLDISFWFLWLLYPSVFLYKNLTPIKQK